jgi:hypothetical protein
VKAAVVGQDAQAVVGYQARLSRVVPDLVAFLIDVGLAGCLRPADLLLVADSAHVGWLGSPASERLSF